MNDTVASILNGIKTIAPWIAGTFGTPFAGAAVGALCAAIPDQAATLQAAHTADPVNGAVTKLGEMLQAGTVTAAQIKQAELAHAENMAQWGFKNAADLEKIAADDRASARDASVKGGTARDLLALSVVLLIITLGSEVFVLFHGYPDELSEIVLGRILGLMDAVTMLVLSFWYGTTHGSQSKDDTIASIAKNGNS